MAVVDLLPEVLDKVFSYCSSSDVKNLSLVSSHYNKSLQPWLLHTVKIPPSALPLQSDKKMLKKLEKHLRNENIQVLCLQSALTVQIPDNVLKIIGTLHHLVALDLTKSMTVNDSNFHLLCADMDQLKVLDLTFTQVGDAGFKNIRRLKGLEELRCCHCNITNKSLVSISQLKSLFKLDLSNCVRLTDISPICGLLSLEKLGLEYCSITDEGLLRIGGLTALRILNISSCYHLTDAGFGHLSTLANLTDLDASVCCGVSDVACEYIGMICSLEKLSLRYCSKITDKGVMNMSRLTNLKKLNMAECRNISDDSASHIAKFLTSLVELKLSHCGVTVKGTAMLKEAYINVLLDQPFNLITRSTHYR